jgi:hypothetical protein
LEKRVENRGRKKKSSCCTILKKKETLDAVLLSPPLDPFLLLFLSESMVALGLESVLSTDNAFSTGNIPALAKTKVRGAPPLFSFEADKVDGEEQRASDLQRGENLSGSRVPTAETVEGRRVVLVLAFGSASGASTAM